MESESTEEKSESENGKCFPNKGMLKVKFVLYFSTSKRSLCPPLACKEYQATQNGEISHKNMRVKLTRGAWYLVFKFFLVRQNSLEKKMVPLT